MSTDNTSLIARANLKEAEAAITEFDRVQAGIADLKTKYDGVIFPVATTAGMREAVAARAAVREPRLATEKARKAGKAPLLALGKIIDEKAKWITAELVAIEDPIDEQIKAEEARKEAERQAKANAERKRIAAHQEMIGAIRERTLRMRGESSVAILADIKALEEYSVSADEFEEFADAASKAKAETLEALHALHTSAVAREEAAAKAEAERIERERLQAEEAARLAAERKELERMRAEQAERDRIEAQRISAERAEFARQQAEAAAKQRKAEEEAEVARREADAKAARERAEADRVAREAREAEQAKLDAERAEIRRQQDAIAAERRKQLEEAAANTNALRAEIDKILDDMSDGNLAEVLRYLRSFVDDRQAAQ